MRCHLAWHRLGDGNSKGVVSPATETATHSTASARSAIKKGLEEGRGGGDPSARRGSATMRTEIRPPCCGSQQEACENYNFTDFFSIVSYDLPSGPLLRSRRMGPFLERRPISLFSEKKLVCAIACVLLTMFRKVETPPEFLYRLCREIVFPYCIMRNAVEMCYARLIFLNFFLMYGGKRNFSTE